MKVLLLLLIGFSLYVQANEFCQQKIPFTKNWTQFVNTKTKFIVSLKDNPVIVKEADKTLSSLLSAQSPLISNWIKKRNLNINQPEKVVKEWRSYYAENFVLKQHPSKNEALRAIVNSSIKNIYNNSFPKSQKQKFQDLFKEAKKDSISYLQKLEMDPKTKEDIIKRVSSIKLHWYKDFNKKVMDILSWGIAYSPSNNQVVMGLEALKYKSNETLYSVFTHEIGHSFDPCRWNAYFKTKNPFEKIVQCLRSSKSVQAKKRDDKYIPQLVQAGRLSKQLALALKYNPTCNKKEYPPIGVQADQSAESFADWFSAEVVAKSKYISTKLRQDLCDTKKLSRGSSYPTNQNRLYKIYMANPQIKKRLSKTTSFKASALYCKY